jgi:hypothetical protein
MGKNEIDDMNMITLICNSTQITLKLQQRFAMLSHSNQNTQSNIESYHGALKRWFSFEIKGVKRYNID